MTLFDSMETVLRAEARIAGLFSHRTTIGTAREFFVSRILGSILPKAVSVGSGQALHLDGLLSKQLDVVIHDDRFPVIQLAPGASLFLAEGVAASVEVKSELNKQELERSLQVSASLISNGFPGMDHRTEQRIGEVASKQGISPEEARMNLAAMLSPKSFVYAYNASISIETLLDTVRDSLITLRQVRLIEPRLPRVIVAGNLLAISRDEHLCMEIQLSGQLRSNSADKILGHVLFTVWETDRVFGVLASILLHLLQERLRPEHGVAKIGWMAECHLPLGLYFKQLQELPTWHLIAQTANDTTGETSIVKRKIEPPKQAVS